MWKKDNNHVAKWIFIKKEPKVMRNYRSTVTALRLSGCEPVLHCVLRRKYDAFLLSMLLIFNRWMYAPFIVAEKIAIIKYIDPELLAYDVYGR